MCLSGHLVKLLKPFSSNMTRFVLCECKIETLQKIFEVEQEKKAYRYFDLITFTAKLFNVMYILGICSLEPLMQHVGGNVTMEDFFIFESSFQQKFCPGWSVNVKKQITKTVYIYQKCVFFICWRRRCSLCGGSCTSLHFSVRQPWL